MMQNKESVILNLPLHLVKTDPEQPRKHFDAQALQELADSIKEYGLLEPIGVRDNNDGTYTIVHGERRFRAHKLIPLPTIKAIICPKETDVKNTRITENTAREDLTDMDLAREFEKRVLAGETHEQIALRIHKTRAYVSQRLSLLKLSEEQQGKLQRGDLTFASARILAASPGKVENPEQGQEQHGYAVTMADLETFKLFEKYYSSTTVKMPFTKSYAKPILDELYEALRKDINTLRRALA